LATQLKPPSWPGLTRPSIFFKNDSIKKNGPPGQARGDAESVDAQSL
jgi:hypothetical protein